MLYFHVSARNRPSDVGSVRSVDDSTTIILRLGSAFHKKYNTQIVHKNSTIILITSHSPAPGTRSGCAPAPAANVPVNATHRHGRRNRHRRSLRDRDAPGALPQGLH